ELLGIKETAPDRFDPEKYDDLRAQITERFASRTQAEWAELFEGTDACVAAIIPISEAKDHPHLAARGVFVERDGMVQPAPAPRFSRTVSSLGRPPSPEVGSDTREALAAWGITDVDALIDSGAAVQV
ncbi:MAG: CoA transferase, partial [Nocardioides sp.]